MYRKVRGSQRYIGFDPSNPSSGSPFGGVHNGPSLPNDGWLDIHFNPSRFMLIQNDCSLKLISDGATYNLAYDAGNGKFVNQYTQGWFDFVLTVQPGYNNALKVVLTRQRNFLVNLAPLYGTSADFALSNADSDLDF